MKRLLITFGFLLTANSLLSQNSLVFSGGYGMSTIKTAGTMEIIEKYNNSNQWLDQKMGATNPVHGLYFSFGKDKGNYSWHVGLNLLNSITSASGTDLSGSVVQTDLKTTGTFYSFNGLWDFGSMWGKNYGLGLNMGIALGGITYKIKESGAGEFSKATSGDGAGLQLGIFYEHYLLGDDEQGIGIRITPFYKGSLGLLGSDANKLWEKLDSKNSYANGVFTKNKYGFLGLTVDLTIRIDT